MSRNITAYTAPDLPAGGEYAPFVSINREADGQVAVLARNADGVTVEVVIPHEAWFHMARQAYACRGLVSMN